MTEGDPSQPRWSPSGGLPIGVRWTGRILKGLVLALAAFGHMFLIGVRRMGRILKGLVVVVLAAFVLVFLSNLLFFPSYRHIPSRALATDSASCLDARSPGWDALATANNSEWTAIDQNRISARKLACRIASPEDVTFA